MTDTSIELNSIWDGILTVADPRTFSSSSNHGSSDKCMSNVVDQAPVERYP